MLLDTPTSFPALADPGDRDFVGDWYRARLAHGIDDRMWLGFFDNDDDQQPRWHTAPHRGRDGIGALADLFARRGWQVGELPRGRDTAPPPLPARLQALLRRSPPLPAPGWRALDPARMAQPHERPPVARLLSADDTARIDASARAAGTSTTLWLLLTADRATRYLLATPDSALPWLFPVNLRGAVQCARPTMNHCSGINLVLQAQTTPAQLREQMLARMAALEHWRTWQLLNLGRQLGQGGVALLYRLAQAAPGRYAGSYSNLGDWPGTQLDGGSHDPLCGLVAVAPGSPGWPVSAATLRWQDRRTLACRLHPVLDSQPGLAEAFVEHWQQLATA